MAKFVFETGKRGDVVSHCEGKIAFAEKNGPQPKAGEIWEAEPRLSVSGKVYILRLKSRWGVVGLGVKYQAPYQNWRFFN